MKSLLYTTNGSAQVVIAGGTTLNVGSVIRRYGNNANVVDGNVAVQGSGFYNIDAHIDISADAIGTMTITLYKDGIAIPGASTTISTEATGRYSIEIPATIRQVCCQMSTITIEVSGGAGTVNSVSVRVVKE